MPKPGTSGRILFPHPAHLPLSTRSWRPCGLSNVRSSWIRQTPFITSTCCTTRSLTGTALARPRSSRRSVGWRPAACGTARTDSHWRSGSATPRAVDGRWRHSTRSDTRLVRSGKWLRPSLQPPDPDRGAAHRERASRRASGDLFLFRGLARRGQLDAAMDVLDDFALPPYDRKDLVWRLYRGEWTSPRINSRASLR